VTLTDGETYTATVTAFDRTADVPWSTDSDALTFRVDSSPEVSSPQDGQVLAFGARDQRVVVNFDRPIDTSTKSGVTLARDSSGGTSTGASGPNCASPCSSVSFTPDSNGWREGRYTLTVNVKSEEGVAMQKTIRFAVPSSANETDSVSASATCNAIANPMTSYSVTTQAGNETVLASFVPSIPAGAVVRVRVLEGGNPKPDTATLGSGDSGTRRTLSFTETSAGAHPLSLEYCLTSGSGTFSLNDIYVSRAP
jgi:hypothetical protein